MVIVCTNCASRLQIADEKVPKHAFSLRCPKCQSVINSQPPAPPAPPLAHSQSMPSAPLNRSMSNSMAAFIGREGVMSQELPTPAPSYMLPGAESTDANADATGLLRQLLEALQGNTKSHNLSRARREQRHVLVCVSPARREPIARLLAEKNYRVYVAENYRQATDRLHDEHMHVIILDVEFAPEENGFRTISQEAQTFRPMQRRQVILVKIAPDVRTLDQHAAFLQSFNLLINTADINILPDAMERSLRHYNDLYKDFFQALNVAPV